MSDSYEFATHTLAQADIEIPFPQRDVHLYPDTAETPTRS